MLVGDCWRDVVDAFKKNLVVSDEDIAYLDFAHNAEDAAKIIIEKSKAVVVHNA